MPPFLIQVDRHAAQASIVAEKLLPVMSLNLVPVIVMFSKLSKLLPLEFVPLVATDRVTSIAAGLRRAGRNDFLHEVGAGAKIREAVGAVGSRDGRSDRRRCRRSCTG